jgi:hypothetical protein
VHAGDVRVLGTEVRIVHRRVRRRSRLRCLPAGEAGVRRRILLQSLRRPVGRDERATTATRAPPARPARRGAASVVLPSAHPSGTGRECSDWEQQRMGPTRVEKPLYRLDFAP